MKHPTKPGQLCRVIGGRSQANDEGTGPNIGKTVTTLFLHQMQAGDCVPVWHCKGEGLQTYYGAGTEADFLKNWLEVLEEDSTQLDRTTTKELCQPSL